MSNLVVKFTQEPFFIKAGEAAIDEARKLTIKDGMAVPPQTMVKTPNLFTCTAIILISKLLNKVMHIAPELESAENVRKFLKRDIESIRAIPNNSDVDVVIIGGIETKFGDRESEFSQRIYNAAAEVAFDDCGCDGVMICGKRRGDSLENIKVEGNEVTVYKKGFDINTQSLEDKYQTVETYGAIDIIG